MRNPIHVNDEAFESMVLEADKPVVVDFWAPWCGPCRMIAPILEELAAQYEGRLTVAKVNTDENPEWMMKYGVMGIPTLLFINQGKVVDRQVGVLPRGPLQDKVEKLLAAAESVAA